MAKIYECLVLVLWRQNYLPFGKELEAPAENSGNDINYTGHQRDDESDLTYMQARYYDPVVGRFYSNDPIGFVPDNIHSFGRYTYVNNNPYKYTDPNGEYGVAGAMWGGMAGLIGGALTGYQQGGFQGAIVGGGVGAAAGAAVGLVMPTAAGAFATNAAASIVGQMGGNLANGADNATDNVSVSAAVGAGLGGAVATTSKVVSTYGPKFKDVIGSAMTTKTGPSTAIGSSIVAVGEGVGTAVGETVGKKWGELKDKMVKEIKEGTKDKNN